CASGNISMWCQRAPRPNPVPSALRMASLAAKRPAMRSSAAACRRQYASSAGVNRRARVAGRNFPILSTSTMSVPTPVIMPPKLASLGTPEGAALLRRVMDDGRDDLSLAATPWMRVLPAWQRTALLEQRGLRARGLRKQSRAAEMLFTPLGLQQMTAEALGRYKASRLPAGATRLADLCCGPGGDSLHLAPSVSVLGVDRDPETLRAWRHNVALHRPGAPALAVRADVTAFAARVDGILLDPA